MFKYSLIFLLLVFNLVYGNNLEFSFNESSSSQFRKIVLLNKNWTYKPEEEIKRLNVPFWLDEEKIVIENRFKLNEQKPFLNFLLKFEGVRGLEALYFNDERIPFDPFELEEYEFKIPSNIVKENGENFIKIILSKKLRLKEQNVLASRLELPERKSGIFKDVYIEILPSISITNFRFYPQLDKNLSSGKINYAIEISSSKHIQSDTSKPIRLMIDILDGLTSNSVGSMILDLNFSGASKVVSGEMGIKNPTLWDIQKPYNYKIEIKLF